MITNFHHDLERASAYEIKAAQILETRRQLTDVRHLTEYQKKDIDFLTAENLGVEIKVDFTDYEKLNIVVEIMSNSEKVKLGFLYTSEAKWFAFYFPNKTPRKIIIIQRNKLIKYVENNFNSLKKIKSRTEINKNNYYTSEAVLVDPTKIESMQMIEM